MKSLCILALLIFCSLSQARQMYKVKCYTPDARDDRTKLSKYIHLDMITNEYVVAIINQYELQDLQKNVNLEIEILSAFETDKMQTINENFNMQLLMADQGDQGLDLYQEYYVSAKSQLSINLNELVKEKIPNENRSYSFSMQNVPSYTKKWNYNAADNQWMSTGEDQLKGKQDQIKFETSSAVNPMIKITLILNYL